MRILSIGITQATVFMYAGSYDLVTSPLASLIFDKSVALIDPSLIGSSYVLPIHQDVISFNFLLSIFNLITSSIVCNCK